MKRIGLLSDTHSFLPEAVMHHFADCNEIWHAGDFGSMAVIKQLQAFKPLKGVYGNIDDTAIRQLFPEILVFNCEDVKVMIKHIGGYPPKFNTATKPQVLAEKPLLFISGHSHILKIFYDITFNCLHINPGAAGKQGWHKVQTLVKFDIDGKEIKNCAVIEL